MSDALFYEFTGVSAGGYKAVNAILGLDPATGAGDWPAGLLSHTGADSRLGPALGQAQVAEPTRIEWLSVMGTTNIERS